MRTTRSTGFIAVTLTIALLAFEAVAVLGVAQVVSSWTPPRVAALARAGATTWSALARSTQRRVVTWTLPAALGAVRTTTEVLRAAYLLWPAAKDAQEDPPVSQPQSLAIVRTSIREDAVVHACKSPKVSTRVVCAKVTRTHNARNRSRTS